MIRVHGRQANLLLECVEFRLLRSGAARCGAVSLSMHEWGHYINEDGSKGRPLNAIETPNLAMQAASDDTASHDMEIIYDAL